MFLSCSLTAGAYLYIYIWREKYETFLRDVGMQKKRYVKKCTQISVPHDHRQQERRLGSGHQPRGRPLHQGQSKGL